MCTCRKLAPKEQAFFTWEDPKDQKCLVWNGLSSNNKKEEIVDHLRKDGLGKLWVPNCKEDDPGVYWVSFLSGMQRVLLFTANPEVAHEAKTAYEPISMEVTVSIQGIGLSLVSEIEKRTLELLYMQMARFVKNNLF
jgi:hypothetical protein